MAKKAKAVPDPTFEITQGKNGTDYVHGQMDGQDVYFKKTYGEHEFTDKEIVSMLKGEEIKIPGRDGNEMPLKLGPNKYMGHEYIGPVRTDLPSKKLPAGGELEEATPTAEAELG